MAWQKRRWVEAGFERLDDPAASARPFWIGLAISLLVPLYYASLTLLYQAQHPYIVQDDARQHVVYLQRLLDPNAFADDLIADYFTTVAPAGYRALYGAAAQLGLAPLMFAKLLPIGLSLVATSFLYGVAIQLWPVALNGVLSTLIFNQLIWLNDDLVSATPRAFVYPIFAAFLYYLLRRRLIPCLITLLLQGLFFPQLLLVQVTMLALRLVWPLGFRTERFNHQDLLFLGCGLTVAGVVLLPYALSASAFGPVIRAEQMRLMPEYGLGGRNEYFGVGPLAFWLLGNSGLRIPTFPSLGLLGFGLPGLRLQRSQLQILVQLGLASLILYGLAHLLLLLLHFPSRYTSHTFVIGLSLAAGIVLTAGLARGWNWLRSRSGRLRRRDSTALALVTLLAAVVIGVPALPGLFVQFQGWVVGDQAALYEYLKQVPQPRIASLSPAANSLPAFTGASVLVGREFALPHHPNYYRQFIQRTADLLEAQYSPTSTELSDFIQIYRIDYFLIDHDAFTPGYLQAQDWLIHSRLHKDVIQTMRTLSAQQPGLQALTKQCTTLSTAQLLLLDATCLRIGAASG